MKEHIHFRAMTPADFAAFTQATSYWPGPQFGGIVAYTVKPVLREQVMGMVGFDGWTPRTVAAHWMIRFPRCIEPLWQEAVAYIAGTGRKSILGATPSDNVKALRAIRHLGWQELYRIADGWDTGVDIVISEYKIHVANVVKASAVRRSAA